MNRQINETTAVGYDVIKLIAQAYDNLNIYWVITGKGDMFKLEISELSFIPQNLSAKIESPYVAPIYETESLSSDEMVDLRDHKPDRYPFTSMLGVKLFPVIGCSFEPTILAGHYIGAVKLDSYNKIVTENIYYILTKKERMIKRLRVDEINKDILWCISPNFEEFKIKKNDIIEINHVFFYGMML